MVTYRTGLAKRQWRRPLLIRALLVLLGLAVGFVGMVAWSLETEYGGSPDRPEFVIGHEAPGRVVVYGEDGEPVFEGAEIEAAEAFVESHRGPRNYTVSILLLGFGALSMLAGVWPLKRELDPHA